MHFKQLATMLEKGGPESGMCQHVLQHIVLEGKFKICHKYQKYALTNSRPALVG
jgi:hypothetical protein